MIRANGTIYFSDDELKCPDTGIVRLADGFANKLLSLRMAFGRPMTVTSACRSAVYNAGIDGHPRSLHVYDHSHHKLNGCAAIDIAETDPRDRGPLVVLAWTMGWSVGVHQSFTHLDRRDFAGLPQRMFGY